VPITLIFDLERSSYPTIEPLKGAQIKIIESPLISGYVFCRFHFEQRLAVLRTPGIVSVVGFGGKPTPVDESEMARLQAVAASGRDAMPWPYLRVGQRIRLCGGCLHGLEGLLLDLKNGRRIVVSVTLLQRAVAVHIDREDVEPVL
jgi:transcription antitermination factor NusG